MVDNSVEMHSDQISPSKIYPCGKKQKGTGNGVSRFIHKLWELAS